jgi:CelD/BcsL family acetyltransferase involved in cellulose biosynthesis
MPHCLRFDLLDPAQADHVAGLERTSHRASNVTGREALAHELGEAEREDSNLSLGLYDGAELVGYVLAYVMPIGLNGDTGETVYLSDVALKIGYRRHMPELIARWRDLIGRYCPHTPIEIHADEPEMKKWRTAYEPVFADLGYRMSATERVDDRAPGLARFWARWEPAPPPRDDARALPVLASCTVAGESYDVRVVYSATHWARLERVWDELVHRTADATGMQSFAYQRTWWNAFGLGDRLWIATIWHGETLVGIAPLRVRAVHGPLGWARELTFIGTRWEVDRPTFLFGDHVEACTVALLHALAAPEAPWDRISLYEQSAAAHVPRALSVFAADRGCLQRRAPDSVCPYLVLDRSFDDYFASRSKHFRKRVRAAHRKLESQGELRLERVCDWPQVREALASYRELERTSWKNASDVGLGDDRRSRFFDELLAELGPKGQLHVLSLSIDGRTIAATIAFVHGRQYYSLQIVHDAEWAEFSPGTVLEYLELTECHGGGYAEYDFLGGFLNNKLRWTSTVRETIQLQVARRTPRELVRHAWHAHVSPRARALLERAGLLERALKLHEEVTERVQQALDRRT